MSNLNGAAAAGIVVLLLIALWGQWRPFFAVAAIQSAAIVFNLWFNFWALPRGGRHLELVRTGVNFGIIVVTTSAARWVVPVWLFLPFLALALDHLGGRVATLSVLGTCLFEDAWGLWNGVAWIYPLTFTALAVFCLEISRLKHATIRDMLRRSDEQRFELESSHALLHDAHRELKSETRARRDVERELQQAQKLEAVGRLAAGVAHEINTPVQFVSDSVHFLRDASADLVRVLEALQRVNRSVLDGHPSVPEAQEASHVEESADLPYLFDNVPKAFDRALDGLGRVATIVRSMKEFAHPDSTSMSAADLNRAIESTLTIARNEYKYVAELETDFGPLPPVQCRIGDVNQMVLNIVVNAAHAIGEVVAGTERLGRIRVQTRQEGDDVVVSIADTGPGIPEEIRSRVFDPFFTTKEVGKGTGQGLSIARAVAEAHKGQLRFETEVGKGTTFTIRLPIQGCAPPGAIDEAAA